MGPLLGTHLEVLCMGCTHMVSPSHGPQGDIIPYTHTPPGLQVVWEVLRNTLHIGPHTGVCCEWHITNTGYALLPRA